MADLEQWQGGRDVVIPQSALQILNHLLWEPLDKVAVRQPTLSVTEIGLPLHALNEADVRFQVKEVIAEKLSTRTRSLLEVNSMITYSRYR